MLAACGGGGTSPAPVPAAPVISAFAATPPTLLPGQSANLSWSVSGATSLRLDPGGTDVTGTTARAVSPAATTTYILTASGPGGSASASVLLTVTLPSYDFSPVTKLLQQNAAAYPGGVAVLLLQGDREIYRYSAGGMGDTDRKPIASATKWYSGAVVLRLADKGMLRLDDPIGLYLPVFPRPGKGDITLRQCFGMTSGLVLKDPDYETDPTLTLEQSVNLISQNTPVVFSPGTQLAYEGDGMQVVGRICEVVTGQDWRTLAQDELFGPLGMADSDYWMMLLNPCIPGGARSTLADEQKFLRMVLDNGLLPSGNRFLSQASVQVFFTNGTRGLPEYDSPWPVSGLYAYGQRPDYGFGSWILAENPATGLVEEVSSPGKFGTWSWVDRRRNLRGVIFMADLNGFALSVYNNLQVLATIRSAVDKVAPNQR